MSYKAYGFLSLYFVNANEKFSHFEGMVLMLKKKANIIIAKNYLALITFKRDFAK